MSWFCKHEWKLLHAEEVKPLALRMVEAGMSIGEARGPYMLKGYTVAIVACEKCGKIKKFQSEVDA